MQSSQASVDHVWSQATWWVESLPGWLLGENLVLTVWDPPTCSQWWQPLYSSTPKGHNELLRIITAHHSGDFNGVLILLMCSLRDGIIACGWCLTSYRQHLPILPMLNQWIFSDSSSNPTKQVWARQIQQQPGHWSGNSPSQCPLRALTEVASQVHKQEGSLRPRLFPIL